MLETLIILVALATTPQHTDRGLGSTFFPKEKLNDGHLACDASRMWTDAAEPVCASRTIPCGTWVLVTAVKTGRSAWCHVLDRGPYGSVDKDGKWVVKRPGDPATKNARWRGVIDLGPAVTTAIGLPGMGGVILRWWPGRRQPHKHEVLWGI